MRNGVHSRQPKYRQVGFILYGQREREIYDLYEVHEIRKHAYSNLINPFIWYKANYLSSTHIYIYVH